jgi:hypothetical protein
LKIIISASNAFSKWMKLDLPRIPSINGKKIGTQTLITDSKQISWQCHLIKKYPRSPNTVVIAVEAHSRYAIIIPMNNQPPTQAEFQHELCRLWCHQMAHLMIESEALAHADIPEVFSQFDDAEKEFEWFKNTDLSVNGHVSDTEQWIVQSYEQYGYQQFDEDEAFGLGYHINQMFKKSKTPNGKKEKFYPLARFVDDSLYRFANGLSEHCFPETSKHSFPNPYNYSVVTRRYMTKEKHHEAPVNSNVVSLDSFRKNKNS